MTGGDDGDRKAASAQARAQARASMAQLARTIEEIRALLPLLAPEDAERLINGIFVAIECAEYEARPGGLFPIGKCEEER